jgi:hypothetical protein
VVFLIALTALTATACATRTTLSEVWMAEARPAQALSRILVIAIAQDEARRRSFEDGFATALGAGNTEAVRSYQLFPAGELKRPVIEKAIEGQGFDGVIVTRMIEIDEQEKYIPPSSYVVPNYYGRGLYGYYGGGWTVVHEPGRTISTTIVRLETHLYDARTADLIWDAHSETFNPDSVGDIIASVTKRLTTRLMQDGLISGS